MKIQTQIDKRYSEMEIHVCNEEMNDKVSEVVTALTKLYGTKLHGTDEKGNRCILSPSQINRFYAEGQKVYGQATDGVYSISKKLYELEEELDSNLFIRISKAEIINIRKIKRLDMNTIGTIKVIMLDGTETYTSRRNVTRLKNALFKGEKRYEDNH